MPASMFDKYGGFASISRAVMAFYDRVLDSDDIGHYFDNIDMARLIDHQTKFIASALGGPAAFTDERLAQSHRHLNLSDKDMDVMLGLLRSTLEEHGLEPQDVKQVIEQVERRRGYVVTRS